MGKKKKKKTCLRMGRQLENVTKRRKPFLGIKKKTRARRAPEGGGGGAGKKHLGKPSQRKEGVACALIDRI